MWSRAKYVQYVVCAFVMFGLFCINNISRCYQRTVPTAGALFGGKAQRGGARTEGLVSCTAPFVDYSPLSSRCGAARRFYPERFCSIKWLHSPECIGCMSKSISVQRCINRGAPSLIHWPLAHGTHIVGCEELASSGARFLFPLFLFWQIYAVSGSAESLNRYANRS